MKECIQTKELYKRISLGNTGRRNLNRKTSPRACNLPLPGPFRVDYSSNGNKVNGTRLRSRPTHTAANHLVLSDGIQEPLGTDLCRCPWTKNGQAQDLDTSGVHDGDKVTGEDNIRSTCIDYIDASFPFTSQGGWTQLAFKETRPSYRSTKDIERRASGCERSSVYCRANPSCVC